MTGYSAFPPSSPLLLIYHDPPFVIIVEVRIRGQRSILLHSVQLVSHSFVEKKEEELSRFIS